MSDQVQRDTEAVHGPAKVKAGLQEVNQEEAGPVNIEKSGAQQGDSQAHVMNGQLSPQIDASQYEASPFRRLITPKRCRWDPSSPPPLRMSLAILYAIVSQPPFQNHQLCY